jgi:hypothetical protein
MLSLTRNVCVTGAALAAALEHRTAFAALALACASYMSLYPVILVRTLSSVCSRGIARAPHNARCGVCTQAVPVFLLLAEHMPSVSAARSLAGWSMLWTALLAAGSVACAERHGARMHEWLSSTYGFMLVRSRLHHLKSASATDAGAAGVPARARFGAEHGLVVVLLRRDLRPLSHLFHFHLSRAKPAAPRATHHPAAANAPGAGRHRVYAECLVQGVRKPLGAGVVLAATHCLRRPAQSYTCVGDLSLVAALLPLVRHEVRV